MTPTDLIAELERASEGSRELSDEVLLACGWRRMGEYVLADGEPSVGWQAPGADGEKFFNHAHSNSGREAPDPTRNVQDVIDWVVPAKCSWEVRENKFTNEGHAWVYDPNDNELRTYGKSTVPALAFCIACLRARHPNTTTATKKASTR